MDGHQYEHRCAQYLGENGFTDITVTQGSGDQGIDVIAYKSGVKYGIQCKYYEGTVGNKAVQEAFAGAQFYDCAKAMVITNSSYTKSATELAQKLDVVLMHGIDAIVLQESSVAKKKDCTPQDEEQILLEQIERMLLEKYRTLRAKYPESPAKDKEIDDYIWRVRSRVDRLHSNFERDFNRIGSRMQWDVGSVNSLRDSRLTPYKNDMRTLVKSTGESVRKDLEDADRYTSKLINSGISEKSVEALIDLIKYIYDNGEYTASINEQVIAKCSWTAKHTRIVEKWKDLREELPSHVERHDRAAEERETRYLRKNLEDTKEKIANTQTEIANLSAALASRDDELFSVRQEAEAVSAKIAALQLKITETENARKSELSPVEERISNTVKQKESLENQKVTLCQALQNLSFFSFKRKGEIKADLSDIDGKISAFTKQQEQLTHQRNSVLSAYNSKLGQLRRDYSAIISTKQQLEAQISQFEKDIRERSTEKKLDERQTELEELLKQQSQQEEYVRSSHKNYLLQHYSDYVYSY